MPRLDCPTEADLIALNLGELPPTQVDEVIEHLECCPHCEERARQLDGLVDTVIVALRKPARARSGTRQYGGAASGNLELQVQPGPPDGLPETVGNYEVLGELGRGAMGVVYQARHYDLQRFVALKVMMQARAGGDELARFLGEAQAVARLQHPNLVQIFEVGQHEGQPFLSLEFVDGGTLDDRLAGKPQPPRQAAEWLETLARAMDAAHQHHIVHRDLKPANVLLTRDGILKVSDFGLAKRLDSDQRITEPGMVAGTPSYMSPEQACGSDALGPASDLFSLGVIFYEMLTGRVPFEGATALDTLTLIRDQEPVPPRRLQPTVPRDLETICLKCLEKEPTRRYGSARALADDLRRFLDGQPILARPTPAWERAVKWARRSPKLAGALAAAALFLCLGGAGTLWKAAEAIDERNLAQKHAKDADDARAAESREKLAALAARDRSEKSLYFSRFSEAALQWRLNHDVAGTAALLDLCQPPPGKDDRRGWEYYHLRRLGEADLATLRGHSGGYIWALAFSPDGKRLVSAGGGTPQTRTQQPLHNSLRRSEIIVWDPATGAMLRDVLDPKLNTYDSPIACVAFSPGGRFVLGVGLRRVVYVWDLNKHKVSGLYPNPPDGPVALHKDYQSWNSVTGAALGRQQLGALRYAAVAVSPDGRRVAAGGDGLEIWEVQTGQLLSTARGSPHPIVSLAFSPDGTRLVSGSRGEDGAGEIRLWDGVTGQPLREPPLPAGAASCVAFSPDGKLVAAADASVRVWEADTGRVVHTLAVPGSRLQTLAFRPDGLELATGGADRTVRLWDLASGTERQLLRGHAGPVRALAYPRGGRTLASGDEAGVIKIWDLTAPPDYTICGRPAPLAIPLTVYDPLGRPSGAHPEALTFDAASQLLTTAFLAGNLETFEAATGRPRAEHVVPLYDRPSFPGRSLAFSADGKHLAALALEKPRSIVIWDPASGQERRRLEGLELPSDSRQTYASRRLSLSKDGSRLAASVREREWVREKDRLSIKEDKWDLRVWDTATGQALWAHQLRKPASVYRTDPLQHDIALSPDGRLLAYDNHPEAGAATTTVEVVEAAGGKPVAQLRGVQGPLNCLAFSGDGRWLACGDARRVTLFDTATWKPLEAPALSCAADQLAFHPGGTRLATVNRDEVKLWDVATGHEVLVLRGPSARGAAVRYNPQVAWSPDGRHLAASQWDGTVLVWSAAEQGGAADRQQRAAAAEQRAYDWRLTQAERALQAGHSGVFAAHWKPLTAAEPPDPWARRRRGYLFARLGQWQEAAADCERALDEHAAADREDWFRAAALRFLAGDADAARRRCRDALARFGRPADQPNLQALTLLTAWLSREPPTDGAGDLRLADRMVREQIHNSWDQFVYALTVYRSGKAETAEKSCRMSLDPNVMGGQTPTTQALFEVLLALSQHAQKKDDDARATLAAVEKAGAAQRALRGDLTQGLPLLVLLQEARHAIGPPAPPKE